MNAFNVVAITIIVGIPKSSMRVPLNKGTPLYKKLDIYSIEFTMSSLVGFNLLDSLGTGKVIWLKKNPVIAKSKIRQPKNINNFKVTGGKISDHPNEYKIRHRNHDTAKAV